MPPPTACLLRLLVVRVLHILNRSNRTSLLVFSKQTLEGQRLPAGGGGGGGLLDCCSSLLRAHEQEAD